MWDCGNTLKQTMEHYDIWAQTYEQDMNQMSYKAQSLVLDLLNDNFSGRREEAQVLDVACGTGLVAKQMVELGFRHFVGVDGSKAMLEQAAKTNLYQDLRLALLGPQPLPIQPDMFDVVIIVGALDAAFVPVSVVRELCHATKPGGVVCISRGNHTGTPARKYKEDLERDLQLMEEEGLWSLVGIKQTERYMENPYLNIKRDDVTDSERYISGKGYMYKKSIS